MPSQQKPIDDLMKFNFLKNRLGEQMNSPRRPGLSGVVNRIRPDRGYWRLAAPEVISQTKPN